MTKRLDLSLEEIEELLELFSRQTIAVEEVKLDKKLTLLRKLKQAADDEKKGKPA